MVPRIFLTALALYALPAFALAQSTVTLTNPLGESDPRVIIARVIQGALSISGSLALLMFVYGGILWLTSMGKSEQVDQGRKILIWATLGIIVIAGAYVAVTAIFNAITTGSVS